MNHTPSVTGMGTCGSNYWHLHLDFLYFLFLPEVHPFLSLQLTIFILLIKYCIPKTLNDKCQKLSLF